MTSTAGGIVNDHTSSSLVRDDWRRSGRKVQGLVDTSHMDGGARSADAEGNLLTRPYNFHGANVDRSKHGHGIAHPTYQQVDRFGMTHSNHRINTINFNQGAAGFSARSASSAGCPAAGCGCHAIRSTAATAPSKECKKNTRNQAVFHVTHYPNHSRKSKGKPCPLL